MPKLTPFRSIEEAQFSLVTEALPGTREAMSWLRGIPNVRSHVSELDAICRRMDILVKVLGHVADAYQREAEAPKKVTVQS